MTSRPTLEDTRRLMDVPVGEFVRRQARAFGPRTLAVFQDGRTLTYGGLDEQSERFASGLVARGCVAGERIGIMLPNSPEFLVASYGAAKAGLQEVPIHIALKAAGLAHILRAAAVRVLVIEASLHQAFAALLADMPGIRLLVVPGRASFDELVAHPVIDLPRPKATDPLSIMFTSGTTGTPKGVVRSHRADMLTALRAAHFMQYRAEDVIFSVFPLAHLNAKVNTLMGAMYVGGSAVLYDRFSASGFWDATRRHGATSASFQGAMLEILWKGRRPEDRDNPLRSGRAAPIPAALHREFEDYFGVELFEAYGASEAGIIAFNSERRPGSFGKVISEHFEAAVMDADDNPVPAGQPGILAVRPRIPHLMFTSYLEMPEETLAAVRNFWYRTGDLVVEGAGGYLSFVARRSETIRRRGENVSPVEVEEAVARLAGVLECAAYGVPSELSEEEVMVAVVVDKACDVTPERIVQHCELLLPRFAVPRFVRFMSSIPRTDSQRAIRGLLKSEGVTPQTWERAAR